MTKDEYDRLKQQQEQKVLAKLEDAGDEDSLAIAKIIRNFGLHGVWDSERECTIIWGEPPDE